MYRVPDSNSRPRICIKTYWTLPITHHPKLELCIQQKVCLRRNQPINLNLTSNATSELNRFRRRFYGLTPLNECRRCAIIKASQTRRKRNRKWAHFELLSGLIIELVTRYKLIDIRVRKRYYFWILNRHFTSNLSYPKRDQKTSLEHTLEPALMTSTTAL